MEERKSKMGISAMMIVAIVFLLLGIIFLPTGIISYLNFRDDMNESMVFLLVFGGIGLLFLIFGVVFLICTINKKLRNDRLLRSGNYIMAQVMQISQNVSVNINGRCPYVVKCSYRDGYGNVHIFKSRNLMFDPGEFLKDNMVRVYIEGEDYKHYYMDIDEILPNVIEH